MCEIKPLLQDHACEDLHYYASNKDQYFTNDTTFEFLPGEHLLNCTNLTITDIWNLTLTGERGECSSVKSQPNNTKPQVLCKGEAGFIFQDISYLTISQLSFVACGQSVPSTVYNPEYGMAKAALGFNAIKDMTLESVTVCNSSGYGILAHNVYGNSTVKNCALQYNRGAVQYRGGNALFNYTHCARSHTLDGIELQIVNSNFSFGGYNGDYDDANSTGTFATGLALTLSCTGVKAFVHNVTLNSNENNRILGYGGNMFIHFYNGSVSGYISNTVTISESRFLRGNSWIGGGLGVTLYIGASRLHHFPLNLEDEYKLTPNHISSCESIVSIDTSIFNENKASSGSGLYINYWPQDLQNNNCSANITLKNSTLNYNEILTQKNKKTIINVGVAITILNGQLSGVSITDPNTFSILFEDITVEYNEFIIPDYQRLASGSAAVYVQDFLENFVIRNSKFQHNNVTGISGFSSYITFHGNITIHNNTGVQGGGMIICESTKIILTPNTTLSFVRNHAKHSGGGINAEEECASSTPMCFYQIESNNVDMCDSFGNITSLVRDCEIVVKMINNTADYAGSQIYGGSVGHCYIHIASHILKLEAFTSIFKLSGPSMDQSKISSDPRMVCFCKDMKTDCSLENIIYPQSVYPGEVVTIHMIIVGQLNGSVPGLLRVNTSESERHSTGRTCTEVNITARSCDHLKKVTYEFGVFHPLNSTSYFTIGQSKYLHVGFKECPAGYELNWKTCECDCNKDWGNIKCNFTNLTLTRSYPAWLGFIGPTIVYQNVCPYDYCLDKEVKLEIINGTFNSDKLCAPNRRGMLCGTCVQGYSMSASSSACIDCSQHSSIYMFGYIIGQLFSGMVLVMFLTLSNWTITDGTLSGLLFYANIFKLNCFIFLPYRSNILTAVISWLNLDFYFTTCVYDGLDSYVKSWLAFVLPVYLWGLIAAIIVLSRRFNCLVRLFGGNGVKILATLIELSYSRLTQAVITALSPVSITIKAQSQTENILLWFYDGSITYLEKKHIPLFLVGAIFGVLIFVHTLTLLFIQPLRRFSHLRCLSWVTKLKPLIDAYTAPNIIRDECHFWVGLLLAVRLVLMITFSLNTRGREDINLTAITTSCLFILTVAWSVGGVYKKVHLNILNSFFIINLGLLSSLQSVLHNDVSVGYFSASLAIFTTCSILACHVIQRVWALTRRWRMKRVVYMHTPLDHVSEDITENCNLLPQLRD